ncbi:MULTISPECIES: hypothetical protein [Streptomyces]|uniref:hypothetical protein n=1 Tax=Streptomyces TaxID=1883 RepID=UPI00163B6D77|nr:MULTISPECIES: hypothetical protein [Streptomyces]MBC2875894.1 hypothetical protein [Streptomyces sp. TYQ1024]UBI37739.1 hypothetical protein K7I03_15520 [Streptomyces mobaraensis]UKW30325.1 hypothetical protein MCU78_15480 [Streptomyces sp. TYQ1024]
MANPHQQRPEGTYDPAGSTQMFRAFVDEGAPGPRAAAPASHGRSSSSGPRVGVILGVVAALAVVAAVAWLALG